VFQLNAKRSVQKSAERSGLRGLASSKSVAEKIHGVTTKTKTAENH
jgi:hypothetical protein